MNTYHTAGGYPQLEAYTRMFGGRWWIFVLTKRASHPVSRLDANFRSKAEAERAIANAGYKRIAVDYILPMPRKLVRSPLNTMGGSATPIAVGSLRLTLR